MSAPIHQLSRKHLAIHPVTAHQLQELRGSCDDMREAIAETSTVAEAFALYQYLAAIAAEMACLVDASAARCEDLMRRLS